VTVSDSTGCVSIATPSVGVVSQWKAHEYEAWVVAGCQDEWRVWSGGDDCRLCGWDTRTDCNKPTITRRRDMGVTSIQAHPTHQHLLATGRLEQAIVM